MVLIRSFSFLKLFFEFRKEKTAYDRNENVSKILRKQKFNLPLQRIFSFCRKYLQKNMEAVCFGFFRFDTLLYQF
jgi:hypothetical protein